MQALGAPVPARVGPADLVCRGAAWVLLACCLLLGVTILVAGEHEATASELQSAIRAGEVSELTVEGSLRGGVAHWRDGFVPQETELERRRRLRVAPDWEVTQVDRPRSRGQVGSWWVPGPAGLLGFLLWVGCFALLVTGPQPWWATRWAWLWLLVTVPWLAVPGFLLFAGPSGILPPRRPRPRISGGEGLVVGLVLGVAMSALGGLVL